MQTQVEREGEQPRDPSVGLQVCVPIRHKKGRLSEAIARAF
jgi:hypothetical protein